MPIWIKIMLRCRTIVVCRGLVSVTHDSQTRVQKEIAISQKKKKTIKYTGKKSKRRPALFGNFHANSNGFELYTTRAHRCVYTGWSVWITMIFWKPLTSWKIFYLYSCKSSKNDVFLIWIYLYCFNNVTDQRNELLQQGYPENVGTLHCSSKLQNINKSWLITNKSYTIYLSEIRYVSIETLWMIFCLCMCEIIVLSFKILKTLKNDNHKK